MEVRELLSTIIWQVQAWMTRKTCVGHYQKWGRNWRPGKQARFTMWGGVKKMYPVLNTLSLRFLWDSHVDMVCTSTLLRINCFPGSWFNSLNNHWNPRRKHFLHVTHEASEALRRSKLLKVIQFIGKQSETSTLSVLDYKLVCLNYRTVPPSGGKDQARASNCHSSQCQIL